MEDPRAPRRVENSTMELESDSRTSESAEGIATNKRRISRSLIVLISAGLVAFSVLVLLVRMPRSINIDTNDKDNPENAPLTLRNQTKTFNYKIEDGNDRKSSKGPLTDAVCRTQGCNKTASILLDSMNTRVKPCDDFFEFACGGWISKNPIPPQVPKWSHFGKLDEETNAILREILNEPMDSRDPPSLNMAKDFYKACSDVDELDRVGLEPVLRLLEDYGGWPLLAKPGEWKPTSFNWMRSMADLKRFFGTSTLFDILINQNVATPNYSTIHLQQPSLFLSRHYLLEREKYSSYSQGYKNLIVSIAKELKSSPSMQSFEKLTGNPSSSVDSKYLEDKAEEIIEFEALIANLTRDGVTVQYGLRNATATVTLRFLQSIFDNYTFENASNKFEMKTILENTFKTSGIKITEAQLVSMGDVNFIGGLFELISATPVETLANYLHFRMLGWIVSGTTKAMRVHVNKYHREIYGLTGSSSRDYICASSVEEKFGLAIASKYLERTNVDLQSVDKVSEIMEQVRKSFLSLLESASWMNETVKSTLKAKARSIQPCIGYPDWMKPDGNQALVNTYHHKLKAHFDKLELGKGGYVQKLWNVRRWLTDQKLKLLNEKFVHGCKWTTFPGQIGAFYDIRRRAVNIPLGVLQPPFFYKDSPAAINYGGIGSILGHEFTHGFTVSGWTETDDGSFTSLSQCFVDQYSKFRISKDKEMKINGALTFDENFPDNGGLLESFYTYKNYSTGPRTQEKLPGLEHLTQDQLFFLGFANIWCSSSRPKGLVDQVLSDHHTPNRFRVIGTLQNSKEFASTWKCPVGSSMNPGAHKKCYPF